AGETMKSGDTVRLNVSDGHATPSSATTSTPQATTSSAPATTSSAPATSSSPSQSSSSGTSSSTPQPTPVSVPTPSGRVKAPVQPLVTKRLAATINYVPSDEPMGTVVSQSPSGGATSKTGTRITLSVSSGPGDKEQETVPDASGQTIRDAVGTM